MRAYQSQNSKRRGIALEGKRPCRLRSSTVVVLGVDDGSSADSRLQKEKSLMGKWRLVEGSEAMSLST